MPRHLLEVVQHHQAGTAPGDGVAELRDRIVLAQWHVQALRHGIGHAFGIARRCQVAKPHAARKAAQLEPAKVGGQPRLAAAANAQQRDQARPAIEAPRQLLQHRLAADKGVALGRQAVADLARRQPQLALQHDAVDLVAVGRRPKRCRVVAALEQFDRLRQPLDAPVAVRDDAPPVGAQRGQRRCGDQGLATQRGGHHARRDGFAHAVHLKRLGAAGDVVGRRLAQRDLAHMQARAGLQGHRQCGQRAVVGDGIGQRVRGLVEEQQEAVGLVDLAAAKLAQQIARDAVVCGRQRGSGGVAQPRRQRGAVDQVGQEKRLGLAHVNPRTPSGRCNQLSGE